MSHLHHDSAQMPHLLQQTLAVATQYLETIAERPPASQFQRHLPPSLSDQGLGAEQALHLFVQRYGATWPASNGPRFWGFVTGGTTPAALMGDWLTSTYDLNLTSVAYSHAANIELEAIDLLRELFGLPTTFEGTFVTGATMSNVVGLAIAREWVARQADISVADDGLYAMSPIPVLSGAAHSSVFKGLALLGMGRKSVQVLPTQSDTREAVDCEALRQALADLNGQPCIVVANAGTVNTGDFDDLEAIAHLKTQFPIWLHVDAAFGGFAACSPTLAQHLQGWTEADSITIDAHKWLNVPYDAAMLLTRHRDLQRAVFQNSAAYLGVMTDPPDFVHLSPENSRRLRALPAWLSLMAYGRSGYRDIVERCCDLAQRWGDRIQASPQFRLLAPVRLNVVCFTLSGSVSSEQITRFLAAVRDDGRVLLTPTVYRETPAIRAAFSNWRTQVNDLDIAWSAMLDCLE